MPSMQWEEAAALRRDHAAKQAELAAAELAKLSNRVQHSRAPGGGGASWTADPSIPPEGGAGSSGGPPVAAAAAAATASGGSSSGGWMAGGSSWGMRAWLEWLVNSLLNRLQLSVHNLHICFKVGVQVWVWQARVGR